MTLHTNIYSLLASSDCTNIINQQQSLHLDRPCTPFGDYGSLTNPFFVNIISNCAKICRKWVLCLKRLHFFVNWSGTGIHLPDSGHVRNRPSSYFPKEDFVWFTFCAISICETQIKPRNKGTYSLNYKSDHVYALYNKSVIYNELGSSHLADIWSLCSFSQIFNEIQRRDLLFQRPGLHYAQATDSEAKNAANK